MDSVTFRARRRRRGGCTKRGSEIYDLDGIVRGFFAGD